MYVLYGFKDGCYYCGKPLGNKYSFCPFTEPMIYGCDREECKKDREERKEECIAIDEDVEKTISEIKTLEDKIYKLGEKQKSLGFYTPRR